MGISDTFACLSSLPVEAQARLCVAALAEPHDELQLAALETLADPQGLARLDLVVDHFGSLLPAACERSKRWGEALLAIARARIVDGGDPRRLAAYQAVAALAGGDGASLLVIGIDDAMPEVRNAALAAIEERLRTLAAQLQSARARGEPEPVRDASYEAVWLAFERGVRSFPLHKRRTVLELLGHFGTRSLHLLTSTLQAQKDFSFGDGLAPALMTAPAIPCAELSLALAVHKAPAVRHVGRKLLAERTELPFRLAVVDGILGMTGDRLAALRHVEWRPIALAVVSQLPLPAALRLLEILVPSCADAVRSPATLAPFLAHPAAEVQAAAARLSADVAPVERAMLLAPLLASPDAELRCIAMREVSQASFPRFLQQFDGMDQQARQVAARALAKIDGQLMERVAGEFASLDVGRRLKALKLVELLDAGADLSASLMELLDDPDMRVRATAIRIVEVAGSADGIKVLKDALAHPDRRMCANAIEAFEQLDDPRHVDLLVPFLRDRDNRVRANAAKALWNLGWPDARRVLVAMVADEDPRMRVSAVWAIRELRFVGAREVLQMREMAERDADVRKKIQEALVVFDAAAEASR